VADNKVVFEVRATSSGFEVVQKQQKKLADAVNKTNTKTQELDKTQEKNYGRQKQGLIQTANSTKNFSKLSQTIGSGSSGLVGAYATLAANVFAASAAFNALRQAAAFQQLVEGFTFMANEAGRTTDIVVERLKDITGQALSTREALQGASLALSAGFETTQLEDLAKVARGASLALGRNLNDAFDRLTRGAIKLEPEILDELGIMVRLDDAVEAYAAKLGKAAGSLTQFQRQQAFLNAINEQGLEKYGDIADAIDVNPYDRLAAAFEDLTKTGLGLVNYVFIPIAELFAGSSAVLTGGLVLFGSTILTQMIPALGQMSQRAAESAEGFKSIAQAAREGADETVVAAREQILAIEKPSASIRKVQGALKKGNLEEINIKKELVLAEKRLATAKSTSETGKTEAARKNATARITLIEQEIAALEALQLAGSEQVAAVSTLGAAEIDADVSRRQSEGLTAISSAGPISGFKEANKQFKDFRTNADLSNTKLKILGKTFPKTGRFAKLAGVGVKFFGTALLNAIPFIGQLIFFGGILIDIFKKIYNSINPTSQALENLGTIVESLPEKFDQLNKKIDEGSSLGAKQIATYKTTAGILTELSSASSQAANEAERLGFEKAESKIGLFYKGVTRTKDNIQELRDEFTKKFETKALDEIGDSLTEIFKDTSEGSKLLREEIVAALTQAGVEINAKTGELGKNVDLKDVVDGLDTAKTKVKDIDSSFDNLKKTVQDGERVFGKFFEKFTTKTEYDDLVQTFTSFEEEINNLTAAGKKAGIEEILDKLGNGAKKFGIDAGNAATKIPKLKEQFLELQTQAVTLKKELALLDSQIDVLKKFENVSSAATQELLDLTNQRVDKEIDGLNKRKEALEALVVSGKAEVEVNNELLGIQAEIAKIENQRIPEAVARVKVKQTELKISKQNLEIQQQTAATLRENALVNSKFNAALKGRAVTPVQQFKQELETAKTISTERKKALSIELQIQEAKIDFMKAEIAHAFAMNKISIDTYGKNIDALNQQLELIRKQNKAQQDGADNSTKNVLSGALLGNDVMVAVAAFNQLEEAQQTNQARLQIGLTAFRQMGEAIGELNSGFGAAIANLVLMAEQIISFKDTVADLKEVLGDKQLFGFISNEKLAEVMAGMQIFGTALQAYGSALQGFTQSRVKEIDRMIEQEKKMDGNSAQSVAKIKALEEKKYQIQKKAFEQDKKIKIATAIINTALAATLAYAQGGGLFGPILAAAITALGMAQVNLIKKTQFSGGPEDVGSGSNTALQIGGRSNNVDVARGATSGELAYLRGGRTTGENLGGAGASLPGSAMGRRGYADGAMLVGERGPEVVAPSGQVDVIPNYALGGQPTNVNFTINAVDGQSVQNMLYTQRGNIIGMIREAANANGEGFLETVDPAVYGGGG